MSDDIIDTIAEAIEDAERSCGPREYQQSATHVLAVLRERYTIVVEKSESDHDPFDILCAVNRGESTKSDAICPRCRPAKEADQ